VPNVLNRYSICARQNLKPDPDGAVSLYIQKDSPSIMGGSWTISSVRKVG
jgi:hypothetical protein